MKFKLILLILLVWNSHGETVEDAAPSVFDLIDKNEKPSQPSSDAYRFSQTNSPVRNQIVQPRNTPTMNSAPSMNNLQMILDKIKEKVTNPVLKDNFTIENVANFFANFISGNQFVSNLEVKDRTELNKVEVKDSLKVKNEAHIENLHVEKLKTKVFALDGDEIVFNPDAVLKLKNSAFDFKVKDIFEVITFMKYIVKICGSKLEKCDFNNLLKNYNANQIMQIISSFQSKEEQLLDSEKKKILEKNDIELKNKTEKIQDDYKFKETEKNKKIDDIENVITKQIKLDSPPETSDDYVGFLENPQMENIINSYYYYQNNLR